MKNILFVITFLLSASLFAQANKTVKAGEKFIYVASYNMSGMMTQLAQVRMETETVKTSKNTLLHLSCEAATFSKWDSYFKIRDRYEAYVNPVSLKPSLYKRDILEGKYTKKEKYLFRNGGKAIVSTSQKNKEPQSKRTLNIANGSMDVVSTLYKLRTIDFSNFKPGQIQTFTVVFDEKEMTVAAKYMGRETVTAGNLGKRECYKISIAAQTKALKGTDKNIIWLTADSKKVPALIKFSIPVGTGQMTLTNASGI